jgi:hypothetical protein
VKVAVGLTLGRNRIIALTCGRSSGSGDGNQADTASNGRFTVGRWPGNTRGIWDRTFTLLVLLILQRVFTLLLIDLNRLGRIYAGNIVLTAIKLTVINVQS